MEVLTSTETDGLTTKTLTYTLTDNGFTIINEAFREMLFVSSIGIFLLTAILVIKVFKKNG
jgi:hypothetical protein